MFYLVGSPFPLSFSLAASMSSYGWVGFAMYDSVCSLRLTHTETLKLTPGIPTSEAVKVCVPALRIEKAAVQDLTGDLVLFVFNRGPFVL